MLYERVPIDMRSLLFLLAFVKVAELHSQPNPRPPFTAPEPSIQHLAVQTRQSSKPVYSLADPIVVSVTGHVKLDGSCNNSTPLYGFQRKEGDVWTDYLAPSRRQMCCGMPSAVWHQHLLSLNPSQVARPAYGQPWVPGEYRAVITLGDGKELAGPPFIVVAVQ